MPLTSTSTLAEVEAAYVDNASYAEVPSVPMARAFVTACRILILRTPKATASREGSLQLNPELLLKEKEAAEAWIAAVASPVTAGGYPIGTVARASFRNCRD